MRVWAPANIEKIRKKIRPRMTSQGFLRALVRAAPPYNLEPSNNHLRNIITGKRKPKPAYVALLADVLGCQTDDFFEKRKVEI